MAQLAARAAIEQMDDPGHPPIDIALAPKLIVRGTTKSPKSAASWE
jgi:DNA-binding LacI/PurR family transcriptional regulator